MVQFVSVFLYRKWSEHLFSILIFVSIRDGTKIDCWQKNNLLKTSHFLKFFFHHFASKLDTNVHVCGKKCRFFFFFQFLAFFVLFVSPSKFLVLWNNKLWLAVVLLILYSKILQSFWFSRHQAHSLCIFLDWITFAIIKQITFCF